MSPRTWVNHLQIRTGSIHATYSYKTCYSWPNESLMSAALFSSSWSSNLLLSLIIIKWTDVAPNKCWEKSSPITFYSNFFWFYFIIFTVMMFVFPFESSFSERVKLTPHVLNFTYNLHFISMIDRKQDHFVNKQFLRQESVVIIQANTLHHSL